MGTDVVIPFQHVYSLFSCKVRERSGSVEECLTRGREAVGSSHTGVTALWCLSIYPSLVLVQTRKTRPCLTERLLMGRKESNQTNKQTHVSFIRGTVKVRREAYNRNRYNQVPHLTQDTTWESDKLTVRHHKREPRGQPFPSR